MKLQYKPTYMKVVLRGWSTLSLCFSLFCLFCYSLLAVFFIITLLVRSGNWPVHPMFTLCTQPIRTAVEIESLLTRVCSKGKLYSLNCCRRIKFEWINPQTVCRASSKRKFCVKTEWWMSLPGNLWQLLVRVTKNCHKYHYLLVMFTI